MRRRRGDWAARKPTIAPAKGTAIAVAAASPSKKQRHGARGSRAAQSSAIEDEWAANKRGVARRREGNASARARQAH
eukprot:1601835-Pleurochrysis_carterae.AAC.2